MVYDLDVADFGEAPLELSVMIPTPASGGHRADAVADKDPRPASRLGAPYIGLRDPTLDEAPVDGADWGSGAR